MVLGHYGTALILKTADKKISLALLFFAATLSDILLYALMIPGIEQVDHVPGYTRWISIKTVSNSYSHGLLSLSAWGLLLAVLFILYRRFYKKENTFPIKSAVIIFIAVISHYACDLLVHVPDLPVLPGSDTRLGLGLWNYPIISNGIEFLIYGIGLFLYQKLVIKENTLYFKKFLIFSVFLMAFHLSTGLVPPMDSNVLTGISMLFVSLAIVALTWKLEKGTAGTRSS